MRWVVRWRLALRIARREALRHPLHSLLVVAMVGLPITAVVTADTLLSTHAVTPVEALPATLGAADVRITGEARGPVTADPVSGTLYDLGQAGGEPWARAEVAGALPPGSRAAARCPPTTSSRSRSTCGRCRQRAHAGCATRRRSRSSSPSS